MYISTHSLTSLSLTYLSVKQTWKSWCYAFVSRIVENPNDRNDPKDRNEQNYPNDPNDPNDWMTEIFADEWPCVWYISSTRGFYSLTPIKTILFRYTYFFLWNPLHFTSLLTAPHYEKQKCLNELSMNECRVTRRKAAVHCLLSLTK